MMKEGTKIKWRGRWGIFIRKAVRKHRYPKSWIKLDANKTPYLVSSYELRKLI